MANENLDTTNKLIKPEDISPSDDAIIRQLSDNLQDISTEDVNSMCDEMDEIEKKKEIERKKSEILQRLNNFRETWEKNIDLDDITKYKIISKVENIPMNINTDGNDLIEFRLELEGQYTVLKFSYPNLENDSDDEYCVDKKYVKLGGMLGEDPDKRGNRKLACCVFSNQRSGLKIPKKEDVEKILNELGEYADLQDKQEQIATLMYMTGMEGEYRLKDGRGEKTHYILSCKKWKSGRRFSLGEKENEYANLFMTSRETVLKL